MVQVGKREKERLRIRARVDALKLSPQLKRAELSRRLAQHDLSYKVSKVRGTSKSRKVVVKTPRAASLVVPRATRIPTRDISRSITVPSMGVSLNALRAFLSAAAGCTRKKFPLASPAGQPEMRQVSAEQVSKLVVTIPAGNALTYYLNPLCQSGYWHIGPVGESLPTLPYTDPGVEYTGYVNYITGNGAGYVPSATNRSCYGPYYDYNPAEYKTWDGANTSSVRSWRKIPLMGNMLDQIGGAPFPPYYGVTVEPGSGPHRGTMNWQGTQSSFLGHGSTYTAQALGGIAFMELSSKNSLNGYRFTTVPLQGNPRAFSHSAPRIRTNNSDLNDSVVIMNQPFMTGEVNDLQYSPDLNTTLFSQFAPTICNGTQSTVTAMQLPSVHGQTTFQMGSQYSQEAPVSNTSPPLYGVGGTNVTGAINSYFEPDLGQIVIMGNSGNMINGNPGSNTEPSYPVFCHLATAPKTMRIGAGAQQGSTSLPVQTPFVSSATGAATVGFEPDPTVHSGAVFGVCEAQLTANGWCNVQAGESDLYCVITVVHDFAIGVKTDSALQGVAVPGVSVPLSDHNCRIGYCHTAGSFEDAFRGVLLQSISSLADRFDATQIAAAKEVVNSAIMRSSQLHSAVSKMTPTAGHGAYAKVSDPDKPLPFIEKAYSVAKSAWDNPLVRQLGSFVAGKAARALMSKLNPLQAIEDDPEAIIEDIPFDV